MRLVRQAAMRPSPAPTSLQKALASGSHGLSALLIGVVCAGCLGWLAAVQQQAGHAMARSGARLHACACARTPARTRMAALQQQAATGAGHHLLKHPRPLVPPTAGQRPRRARCWTPCPPRSCSLPAARLPARPAAGPPGPGGGTPSSTSRPVLGLPKSRASPFQLPSFVHWHGPGRQQEGAAGNGSSHGSSPARSPHQVLPPL